MCGAIPRHTHSGPILLRAGSWRARVSSLGEGPIPSHPQTPALFRLYEKVEAVAVKMMQGCPDPDAAEQVCHPSDKDRQSYGLRSVCVSPPPFALVMALMAPTSLIRNLRHFWFGALHLQCLAAPPTHEGGGERPTGAAACGGRGFRERDKGKWREADRCRPLQTATQPDVMPSPPPPIQ